jgi:hypothetical protein
MLQVLLAMLGQPTLVVEVVAAHCVQMLRQQMVVLGVRVS